MKITIHKAHIAGMAGHSTECDLSLDATTIQFDDGGDEYDLEEVRTIMRNLRRQHARKLDESHADFTKRIAPKDES